MGLFPSSSSTGRLRFLDAWHITFLPTTVEPVNVTGVGFALATSVFGGTAPLLGTYVTASLKLPWLFILYVALAGLVTLTVSWAAVRETAREELSTAAG